METTEMKSYPLPDGNSEYDAVILADGCYPAAGTAAAAVLARAAYVVCCDGAANRFAERGGIPAAIVGDCDSVSPEVAALYADRIHRSAEQETNDLTKAFTFCIEQSRRRIAIVGATGKREDHTIANVSLLAEYMSRADVDMITDWGVFNAIAGDSAFGSFAGQQVSIFTLAPDTPVSVGGLLYPTPSDGLRSWWRGSLNESTGDSFTIITPGPAIIFRTFGK